MPGLDDASGRSTPVAIPSPTPGRYPMTPDQLDEAPAHVHASPSFDYHEERRLHLKDEIWLSHHLPRIPPAAIAESQQPSPSASASVRERTSSSPKSYKDGPQPISTGDVLRDPSPSAFHPKGNDQGVEVGRNVSRGGAGMGMAEEADEEEEEQGDQEDRAHGSRSIQNYPVRPSSMDTPSGPAGGDLDPRPTLLHRGEVDSQEQLDLQEEAQERLLEEQTEAQGLQAAFRLPATSISNSQVLPQPGESLRSTPTPPPSFCYFPLLEIPPPPPAFSPASSLPGAAQGAAHRTSKETSRVIRLSRPLLLACRLQFILSR